MKGTFEVIVIRISHSKLSVFLITLFCQLMFGNRHRQKVLVTDGAYKSAKSRL